MVCLDVYYLIYVHCTLYSRLGRIFRIQTWPSHKRYRIEQNGLFVHNFKHIHWSLYILRYYDTIDTVQVLEFSVGRACSYAIGKVLLMFKAVACRELRLYIKKGTGRGMVVILVFGFWWYNPRGCYHLECNPRQFSKWRVLIGQQVVLSRLII